MLGGPGAGRTDLHVTIDTTGRTNDRRDDFAEVYGDWDEVRARIAPAARRSGSPGSSGSSNRLTGFGGPADGAPSGPGAPARIRPEVASALRSAERDPAGITDAEALALLDADGPELEALTALADDLRRDTVGDDVTYVVTRNINFTNVCYTGCRFCAFAQRRTDADAYTLSLSQVADRAQEAWEAGATEVCMQGGIHPDLPGTAYFDLAAEVKRRVPGMHVHAFSPMEVMNGASRTGMSVREWLIAGPRGGRGLAARHRGRDPRRRRALGADQGQAAGRGVDRGHHHRARAGHPDDLDDDVRPRRHPGALGRPPARDPRHPGADRRVHRVRAAARSCTPARRSTWPGWPGRARPGARTGPCTPWPGSCCTAPSTTSSARGSSSDAGAVRDVLRGGVNDLGGTLMEETISRMAGSENGSYKTISDLRDLVAPTGRPLRQRTTGYGEPSAERVAAAAASDGVCQSVRGTRTPLPLAQP